MEGITLEKLQVIIDAYTKPYRDEVEKVKQKTDTVTRHVEKQTGKIRNAFAKVGRAVGAALSIAAIGAFAKSCIDLGSDLAEVQNVVDVTFGAMSESVNAFAKNAITQFGLSETMAKRYIGTYGAMAKAFGFTTEEAYKMSASITGLTGDVASFYNITQDAAYTKLKSIFSGETESLKDLGIVMTQTALDQYAFNNGLGKTTAKMTEQEKVMLRYQFVMSQLSAAQGDFTRTSGSWANQVRVLQLRFESLKATIGQGLINALTPVIKSLNILLEKLQTVAEVFRQLTVAIFGEAGGGAESGMEDAAGSAGDMAGSLDDAVTSAKELNRQLAKFDELNVLSAKDSMGGGGNDFSGMLPDVDTSIGGDAGEKAAGIIDKITAALERLKQIAKPTTDAIMKLWNEGLKKLGEFTWGTIKDFWENFLKPMGVWMLSDSAGLPRFFNITNDLLNEIDWPRLKTSLAGFYEALQKPAKFVWTGLMDFYEYFLKPVAVWTMGVGLPQLIDALTVFVNTIHWDEINAALKNLWDALAPFAISVGQGLINFFKDLLAVGADFINKVVPGGIQGLADALNSIDPEQAEKLGYALGVIVTALLGLKAIGTIIGLIEKLVGLAKGSFVAKGVVALSKALPKIKDAIVGSKLIEMFSYVSGGAGTLGEAFGACFPKIASLMASIKNAAIVIPSVLQSLNPAMLGHLVASITDTLKGTFLDPTSWDNWIGEFLRYLGGVWDRLADGLIEMVSNFWQYLKEAVKSIFNWDETFAVFGEAGNHIERLFNGEDIGKNLVLGLGKGLVGAISFLIEPINDLVKTLVGGVKELLGIHSPSTVFADIAKNVILGMMGGFKGNWAQVPEWVRTVITQLPEEFLKLTAKLKNAGQQTISGFIEGFKSKFSAVQDWVKKLGDSVSQGLRDALDIHSPSRVTARIAEFFVDGFNFKVRDKIPESVDYTQRWADKISAVKIKPVEREVRNTEQVEYASQSDEETKKLLREQNELLRGILSRTGITTRQVFDAWKQEATDYRKRTGRNPVMA